jgi:hypothetical protein
MATREKRVVDAGMVAHLWAHKAQSEARVKQGNFYFRGDVIYSYGSHFPIARHVTNKRGEKAVLLTTCGYSVTTANHIDLVRRACSHMTVFHVRDVADPDDRRDQFEDYSKRRLALMQSYAKARKTCILDSLRALTAEANAFAAFFGIRSRLKLPANANAMAEECDRVVKAERDRNKRAEAGAMRKAREQLDKWMAGELASVYCASRCFARLPVRLRLAGDELQTSLGARVPKADAIRAFKILRKLRKKAATYKRNGETIAVGPFSLDSMDESGTVKVGCHTIEWAEIERVAKLAGVL